MSVRDDFYKAVAAFKKDANRFMEKHNTPPDIDYGAFVPMTTKQLVDESNRRDIEALALVELTRINAERLSILSLMAQGKLFKT